MVLAWFNSWGGYKNETPKKNEKQNKIKYKAKDLVEYQSYLNVWGRIKDTFFHIYHN